MLATAPADARRARRARRLTWNQTGMRRMLDSIADSPCWRQCRGPVGRARRLTWNLTGMRWMLDSIADSPCWRQRPLTRAARGWARRLTWNLMGMMNNPHYRVKVHAATWQDGMLAMRFEHPVLAGGEAGGCAAPSGPRRQVLQKLFPKEHGPCLSTSVRV